jgi:hypothetical protein
MMMFLFAASTAHASFLEHCVFETQVLEVTSIAKLNGSVTYADSELSLVVKVKKAYAENGMGHTNCIGHKDSIKVLTVTNAEAQANPKGSSLKLGYVHVNSMTPDGVVGQESYSIIEELAMAPFAAQKATLDGSKQNLEFLVGYSGGCAKHVFTLEVGSCLETYPVQCSAQLIHRSNDQCEAYLSDKVIINLSDAGLTDSYYKGASLTIFANDGKQFVGSVVLP